MSDAAVPRRGGNPVGPSMNRLVARRHDLDAAQQALGDSRLLTFTGPGGVGKTRLAVELARRSRRGFTDGVWLAELSGLSVGAGVAEVESALISTLGVTDQSATGPRDRLLSFLADRRLLLVVDNCEHVLSSVRETLPAVLREAPRVRVVATSQEPLGIDGEVVRPVLPLSVPEPATPATQLLDDGSVSLLLERTHAVDPGFQITDDNAPAVIELCRLLDGIPLAIELAAVKLRALTVEQVVRRFGRRLTALTAPAVPSRDRHRSLRAMVEWSYELCEQDAQVLWRRLSVFPATFDLELAEAVCAFGQLRPDDVVDAVERLVGQSILLTERAGGTMRYRLLAPVREVAAELAEQAEETEQLRRRHRDAMLGRAADALEQWCGPHQDDLLTDMRLDHAGHVAAIQWSAATPGEAPAGLRLLAMLRYHWLSGGLLAEGRMRIESLLASSPGPSAARADCVWIVAWIALLQGDHDGARRWLDELAVLAGEIDTPRLAVHVGHWRALLALFTGDLPTALRGFEAAAEGHRAHGDRYLELTARYMLATALVCDGRAMESLTISSNVVALCEQIGDRSARAYALWCQGIAQWTLGHLDDAERSAREVLRIQQVLADGISVALTTELLAWVAYDRAQLDHSAALSAAARHVWRSLGTSLLALGPQLSGFAEQHSARLRPAGEVADLSRFDLGQVIDLGLGAASKPHRTARPDASQPLTKREFEVAALIETGMSNREIAQRLVISNRTAEGHVEHILAKLGFTSRAQVAAWVARRN